MDHWHKGDVPPAPIAETRAGMRANNPSRDVPTDALTILAGALWEKCCAIERQRRQGHDVLDAEQACMVTAPRCASKPYDRGKAIWHTRTKGSEDTFTGAFGISWHRLKEDRKSSRRRLFACFPGGISSQWIISY